MLHLHLKRATRLVTSICLAILLISGLSHQQVEAQDPDDYFVFLPLVMKGGNSGTPPTGPYTQMLDRVQQLCAATGLNQVCTANGQVTLQDKNGLVAVDQPGMIRNLADVQNLSLTSSGTDPQQWSLAWLRLRADSGTLDQALTILAFGNVQLSDIVLFTGQTNADDTLTLPSLQFASSPVAGVTKLGSSGLIVTNPTEEDLLSLTLNGAVVTLGSTALVEVQPGSQMSVTMGDGVSLTEVGDQSSTIIQNHQTRVTLDQSGKATGTPTEASVIDPLEWIFDDLFRPLLTTEQQKALAEAALAKLNRAINRCIAGEANYVYNVLFWVLNIEREPVLKNHIDPAKLAQAYNRAPNCLSFEVDFDSTVASTTGPLFRSSHVHTEGLPVQFLVNGTFIAINTSLDYVSFVFDPPASPCAVSQSTTPGELEMASSSLGIARNKVRITMSLRVAKEAKDTGQVICPSPAPPIEWTDNWWVYFFDTHKGLLEGQDLHTFRFNDWKYTAPSADCSELTSFQTCEHFGEAIYEFTGEGENTTFSATTHLVLVHKPLQ